MLPEPQQAIPIADTPLNDTGTMMLVMTVFFILAITFRTGHKYVSNFAHYMFSVRKRQNAFEDHTVSETLVMIALIVNTCLLMGISFYLGINHFYPEFNIDEHVFKSVSSFGLLYGFFYLFQIILFCTLGYTFAKDKENIRLWLEGFNSTQSVIGLALFPFVSLMLLYPGSIEMLLPCSIILYFCTRLVFIFKTLRIFFNNLSSSIYFILYLCTVEIVPVFLMSAGAIFLSKNI